MHKYLNVLSSFAKEVLKHLIMYRAGKTSGLVISKFKSFFFTSNRVKNVTLSH